MAIEKVQEERRVKFDELAKDIMECKAHIKDVQAYMAEKEDELLKLYSAVDPTSDYEGNESMASEKYQVSFLYKLTKKVDKEEADVHEGARQASGRALQREVRLQRDDLQDPR